MHLFPLPGLDALLGRIDFLPLRPQKGVCGVTTSSFCIAFLYMFLGLLGSFVMDDERLETRTLRTLRGIKWGHLGLG